MFHLSFHSVIIKIISFFILDLVFSFFGRLKIHICSGVSHIQRVVDHRNVRRRGQQDTLLHGDRVGLVLRHRVCGTTLVGRLSQQVHGLERSTQVRSQAHLSYWLVSKSA